MQKLTIKAKLCPEQHENLNITEKTKITYLFPINQAEICFNITLTPLTMN